MYELRAPGAWIFFKFTLCGLLLNLLSMELVHKPSSKAISWDASYMYVSHRPPASGSTSPHERAGSVSFQTVSTGEEGATALQFNSYEPPLPGPTDLLRCVIANGRRVWLCSSSESWTGKEYRVSCDPPLCASTPKESLEHGSIPKAFLWSIVTATVPSTNYPRPFTPVWSKT